ncbi:carbamate kinase [bacterium]|nr:carbamate kinase [bacterium]
MKPKTKKTIVLALGGNALIKTGQKGTIYEQFANTREILESLIFLLKKDYNIVITHGNGPQVGFELMRVEKTIDIVPETPLGVLVAVCQGCMGYMIEQCLQNKLHLHGIPRQVTTVLTQVIVDKNDIHFKNPSKPIGRYYIKEEAEKFKTTQNWFIKEVYGKGFRRVVPSPTPLEIVEKDTIKSLLKKNIIVIAAGGGGIPIYIESNGTYEGVDAVVDKDLATSILAKDINAQILIILTDVDQVFLGYNTDNPTPLAKVVIKEAERYLKEGHFPDGSMGPKIQAAINFIRNGGEKVIITSGRCLEKAFLEIAGTTIIR